MKADGETRLWTRVERLVGRVEVLQSKGVGMDASRGGALGTLMATVKYTLRIHQIAREVVCALSRLFDEGLGVNMDRFLDVDFAECRTEAQVIERLHEAVTVLRVDPLMKYMVWRASTVDMPQEQDDLEYVVKVLGRLWGITIHGTNVHEVVVPLMHFKDLCQRVAAEPACARIKKSEVMFSFVAWELIWADLPRAQHERIERYVEEMHDRYHPIEHAQAKYVHLKGKPYRLHGLIPRMSGNKGPNAPGEGSDDDLFGINADDLDTSSDGE